MLTLINQAALSVLQIVFGIVALRITSDPSAPPDHSRAWRIIAILFLLTGFQALLQDVFAASAYLSGPGSVLWDSYLLWAPGLNHGRTLAFTLTFPLLLTTRWKVMERARNVVVSVLSILFGAMLLGALLGRSEGPLQAEVHYSAVAILDAVELITIFVVLFVVLIRSQVDRLLWAALFTYAFSLAIGAVWMAALAMLDMPGAWTPSGLQMHLVRWSLAAVTVVIAVLRLNLLRRNIPTAALLDVSYRVGRQENMW